MTQEANPNSRRPEEPAGRSRSPGHNGNARSDKSQQSHKLRVNSNFNQAQKNVSINTWFLPSNGLCGTPSGLRPDTVAKGGARYGMKPTGPSNCFQHENFGWVSGTATRELWPKVIQDSNPLFDRAVRVLSGHPKMATQFPGLMVHLKSMGLQLATRSGTGGPTKRLLPIDSIRQASGQTPQLRQVGVQPGWDPMLSIASHQHKARLKWPGLATSSSRKTSGPTAAYHTH